MKTWRFLFLVCFCLAVGMQSKALTDEDWNNIEMLSSSVPEELIDVVTHNVSSLEFVYDKTFDLPN